MRKFELAAIFAVLLAAPAALAQEAGTEGQHDQMADLSILPQGCRDAIQQSATSGMMQGMDMSGMMGSMEDLNEASRLPCRR